MARAIEYKKLMAEMGTYERNYIKMLEEEEQSEEKREVQQEAVSGRPPLSSDPTELGK
jgi:hypothetical protein